MGAPSNKREKLRVWIAMAACFMALAAGFVRAADALSSPASANVNPPVANTLGMKFVWIPAGTFTMGSPKEEVSRNEDETQHKVTLTKGFYMAVHAVTQEQWTKIMGKNPSKFTEGQNLPVEQITWTDCQEFIKKLQETDKKPYRLPTEAEWEYACRAGTTTPFYCGDTISLEQANYNGNYAYGSGKKGTYRQKTLPVGSFPPNPWGLYDMHGNVWQWCQDCYEPKFVKTDATDPLNTKGESRSIRGGSWIDNPLECRSAFRGGCRPTLKHALVGLRLCFNVD